MTERKAGLFCFYGNIKLVVADDYAVEIELIRRGDLAAVLADIGVDAVGEDADEHLTHRRLVQALMPLALLEYQVRAHLALALDAEYAAVERDRGVGLFLRVVLGVFGVIAQLN